MSRRPGTRSLIGGIVVGASLSLAQVSSTVTLSNGVEVKVVASLGQPTGQAMLRVEMARASGDSFYRIFRDQNNLGVFAYELAIGRSANGNEFHFTARPAEDEFAARFPNLDAGKPVPTLSADHEFRTLNSGETDEIGLFEIPGMGLRVTDKIEVTLNEDNVDTGSAGPLQFVGLTVSMNGEAAVGPARGSVSGRYAMFYIPGKGGFFFSTDAPAGRAFVKAGFIDGSHMHFTLENQGFDCIAGGPLLANAESGEIWAYHDPAYRPAGNWTQEISADQPAPPAPGFFTAASDSLSWWLP